MTRDEPAKRFQAANRQGWLIFGPWTLLFIGFLGFLQHHEAGSTEPASLLWLICFFGFLLRNLAAVVAYSFRHMRRFDLVCPHCDKVLSSRGVKAALANGLCVRCNRQFLAD